MSRICKNHSVLSRIGRSVIFTRFSKTLLLCFFVALIWLVIQVLINVKDSNDEWILNGLFVYFFVFVAIYCATVSLSSSLKLIAVITAVFLVVINLIPNLKYVFIYGTYDPLAHYGFIEDTIKSGYVPDAGIYKDMYGPTPGLHIFVSTISIMTGLSVSASMKIFLTVSPLVLPLAVYIVVKRLNMPNELSKLVLVSTALVSPATYTFAGTSSVYFLYVFFLYFCLLFASQKKLTRRDLFTSVIFGTAILLSHDPTSFFLLLYMISTLVIFIFLKVVRTSVKIPHAFFIAIFVVAFFMHFTYVSDFNFSKLLLLLKESLSRLLLNPQPLAVGYYEGFQELPLYDRARVLTVALGRDAVTLLLSFLAPLVMYRANLKDTNLRRFYYALVIPSLLSASVFFLPLFIRPFVPRGLYYFEAMSPFLVGMTLSYFVYSWRRKFKRLTLAFLFFALICISVLQTYPCQPLVPKISTDFGDIYVTDYRQANSVFQREMISFVETHNNQLDIATDDLTRWQMYGLTAPSYQVLISWETPGVTDEMKSSLVLISPNARANPMAAGKRAVAYERYLPEALQTTNIIYMSGESYIFLNLKD